MLWGVLCSNGAALARVVAERGIEQRQGETSPPSVDHERERHPCGETERANAARFFVCASHTL